ncbi:MAG: FMN-binding protein [Erysipelotrichaceae bacterium]|nr:FMN-binding protein [Erysipelotrichaceae bacterium]
MKKSLYLAAFLAWICVMSGGILSIVNDITAPIIEYNKAQAEAANFAKIFGEGVNYKAVEFDLTDSSIEQIFVAGDMGYAYKVRTYGYQSEIVYIVGVAQDGSILGFECLELADTPGFGMKVNEPEYKAVVTSSNIENKIDTISGATITSKAVVDTLAEVGAHYAANFK